MVEISNLTFAYEGSEEITYRDWSFDQKESAIILGESGSGKTTLLHLLGGLMQPTAGLIKLDRQPYNYKSIDKWRGSKVGIVFQRPHLVAALTVGENLDIVFSLNEKKRNQEKKDKMLEKLGLKELRNKKPYQLSQGQSQRVSIARALMNNPRLVLADEPTASLDDKNASEVIELLKTQAKENDAILIIATHDRRIKDHFKNRYML